MVPVACNIIKYVKIPSIFRTHVYLEEGVFKSWKTFYSQMHHKKSKDELECQVFVIDPPLIE